MWANLQHHLGAVQLPSSVPKAWVEKPCIVGTELATGCFEGDHLSRVTSGNANPFFRRENVKFFRFQEETVLAMAVERFPKVECRVVADLRQIDDVTILFCPIADNRRAVSVVSLQIDAEEQAAICPEVWGAQRLFRGEIVIEQWFSCVERLQRPVGHGGGAAYEADLIERVAGFYFDRERAGNDFQIEGPRVPGSNFIKSGIEVCHDACKDVQSSGRAFGVGPCPDTLG